MARNPSGFAVTEVLVSLLAGNNLSAPKSKVRMVTAGVRRGAMHRGKFQTVHLLPAAWHASKIKIRCEKDRCRQPPLPAMLPLHREILYWCPRKLERRLGFLCRCRRLCGWRRVPVFCERIGSRIHARFRGRDL